VKNLMKKFSLRIFIILFAVFFVLGSVFLYLFLFDNLNNKKRNYVEKEAKVKQIVNECDKTNEIVISHFYVRYEMYGNGYITELTDYSGALNVNDKITIYVNPFKPDEISATNTIEPNIMFIVLFSVFYSLSLASFVLLIIKQRTIRNELQDRYLNQ